MFNSDIVSNNEVVSEMEELETPDTYSDVSEIEIEGDRKDAMGDLPDPSSLTLEDFNREYVWKNNGLEKTIWFHKPEFDDSHFRNFFSTKYGRIGAGDALESILDRQAILEPLIIEKFGESFYKRVYDMASKSISGDTTKTIWFGDVEVRAEVMSIVENAEAYFIQSANLNLICASDKKALDSCIEVYKYFAAKHDKRWIELRNIIINDALEARASNEIDKDRVNECVTKVAKFLKVSVPADFIKWFAIRLWWQVVKYHPMNQRVEVNGHETNYTSVLVQWLSAMSEEKRMEKRANDANIDNFFGNAI